MEIKVIKYEDGIVFQGVRDFELNHTFDCGQCFRWKADMDGSYLGVASDKAVRIFKRDEDVYLKGSNLDDIEFWINYFDFNRDYGKIKDKLSEDETLKEAVQHGYGIRILNQDPFETLISFIISANNRIPMIKRAVENISKKYGNPIEFEDKIYYSFPRPEALIKADASGLEDCGCGFRAKYIEETTKAIVNGEASLDKIKSMNLKEAHSELMKLKGIGPKVADCILLFSMEKSGAFPVDVWVKRIMQYFYLAPDVSLKKIRDFGMEKFGGHAGFAQQYLFYYAREKKIGTENI